MKAGLRKINAKDQVKLISRMEFGLEILKMDNLMDTEYGKVIMGRNLKESGRMDATGNLLESLRKFIFKIFCLLVLNNNYYYLGKSQCIICKLYCSRLFYHS